MQGNSGLFKQKVWGEGHEIAGSYSRKKALGLFLDKHSVTLGNQIDARSAKTNTTDLPSVSLNSYKICLHLIGFHFVVKKCLPSKD